MEGTKCALENNKTEHIWVTSRLMLSVRIKFGTESQSLWSSYLIC